MATAYLFNMPYVGHVNPCLAVIQELARRGERVVFYGLAKHRRVVEACGAVFREFEFEETEKGIALAYMANWQMQVCEQTMARLVADAREDRPDYMLVDYTCLWGRFLAQHLRLPTVVIHSTYPITSPRWRLAYYSGKELFRVRDAWRRVVAFLRTDRRISKRWGVARVGMPFDLLRADYGDLHVVLTGPQLSHATERLDDRYVFVGPCIRDAGVMTGEALPPLGEGPLLYASMGTYCRHTSDLYRACIEAFRDTPIQVLITGRDRIDPQLLTGLPPNIHIVDFVDQIEVLKRASAFITHGGMNSVCEALVSEVPMLVHPLAFDQHLQAKYVGKAGVGLKLQPTDIAPARLRELVERMMADQEVRNRCREVGRQLRELGGSARAADLIMSIRGVRRVPAERALRVDDPVRA